MSNNPLVSVIIPVFPSPWFLPRALASLQMQSDVTLEVIVVTDGVSVEEQSRCEEIAEKFPGMNIKIFHHHINRSTLQARLTGLYYALGDYVTFLDPDDEYEGSSLLANAVDRAITCGADAVSFRLHNQELHQRRDYTDHEAVMNLCWWKFKHMRTSIANFLISADRMRDAVDAFDFDDHLYLIYGEDSLFLLALAYVSNYWIVDPHLGRLKYNKDNPNSINMRVRRDTKTKSGAYRVMLDQMKIVRRLVKDFCVRHDIKRTKGEC